MYKIGKEEVLEIESIINSGKIFRYGIGNQCSSFEARYAEKLNVKNCVMTASGTNSLTAALVAADIGPGDEVVVPACTYMATPISVLAAGAIPVIVDIDESVTISPTALKAAIGPRTRAVIPVHMWGVACDMDPIMEIASEKSLIVIEDACQGVGGAYKERMLGSIGHIGAFSFNYFKNMTCGEGGAVVTNNDQYAERIKCVVDPCSFYWEGRDDSFAGFTYNGARASEFEGAILNIQLNRIDGMIESMRNQKMRILSETASSGLKAAPARSLEWECGTHVMYSLDTAEQANKFAELTEGTIAIKTGRHVYTEWDPILKHRGAHHPALNPYKMKENQDCRMTYTEDMCSDSLDILSRTVFVQTHPDRTENETDKLITKISEAAKAVL
ncbi:MAG: DegT/DnrJ/EryC1/StrS family aminotransferase [Spirochaetales bacterium]|jgi:dTDP-4-amino-4,6-dideoxygalactose transaminase|nr:DegT/DnrJ/EryC1/StrS family aminotransferase [Spirochaetales bacterium]